jgi:hypothetical protein
MDRFAVQPVLLHRFPENHCYALMMTSMLTTQFSMNVAGLERRCSASQLMASPTIRLARFHYFLLKKEIPRSTLFRRTLRF